MTIYGLILISLIVQSCCAEQLETALQILTEKLNDLTTVLQGATTDKSVTKNDQMGSAIMPKSELKLEKRYLDGGMSKVSWFGKLLGVTPQINYSATYAFDTKQSIMLDMQDVTTLKSVGYIADKIQLDYQKEGWQELLSAAYTKSLKDANEKKNESIVFPTIIFSDLNDDFSQVAKIGMEAVLSFFEQNQKSSLKKVVFACWVPKNLSASAFILDQYMKILDAQEFSNLFQKTKPFPKN